LWCAPTDPVTLGLAGAAQVIRVHRHFEEIRRGRVTQVEDQVVFGVTCLFPEEAGPQRLLQLVRDQWSIENGQHYRRDRTQDEDRCTVRETATARVLSVFRSLSIWLFKRQSKRPEGKQSLPDFQSHVHRKPWGVLRQLTGRPKNEDEP
jgi:predicted transposase YbfD/YdcC